MKETKSNFIVYLYFMLMTMCKTINLTQDSLIYIIMFVVGCILLIIKMFNDEFSIKEVMILILLIITSLMIAVQGKNLTPLHLIISISCLKNVNLKNIIKTVFFTKLIFFIIMIFLSSTGIIQNNFIEHYREGIGISRRYCFGYSHPNITHMNFISIIVMYYYLYRKKINIFSDIFCVLLNFILFYFTYSRTSLYLCNIFILYHFIRRIILKIDKPVKFFSKYSFIFLFGLSIAFAYLWDKQVIVREIDEMLTGRIYYCYLLLKEYSIPLIGGNVYNGKILFDNSFFSLLYQCGLVFTILIIYLTQKSIKYMSKNGLDEELIIFTFMIVMAFSENIFISPVINFTIIFLAYAIFNQNTKKRGEKNDSNNNNSNV